MKVKLLGEYPFEFPESNNPKKDYEILKEAEEALILIKLFKKRFKKSLGKSSKMCQTRQRAITPSALNFPLYHPLQILSIDKLHKFLNYLSRNFGSIAY